MNEATGNGQSPIDREGLHEILGYSGLATRIVNRLIEGGVGTPHALKQTTYSELLDIPGISRRSQEHIMTSLEYFERTQREGR